MYSSIVRAQTAYLQYMIVQRCLAQMKKGLGQTSGAPIGYEWNLLDCNFLAGGFGQSLLGQYLCDQRC
ncbi:MAG: hypothetical protein C0398_05660 [Coprothermobacter sp.]|nr:hypothetical protein [Coprothermobacter sp.]